jgi:hypothetical protein
MRSTLYEALEIDASSEEGSIRAALRKVLRRFWSAPRDASGDSEEAVRFVALAAGILTDDARRQRYDVSARPAASSLNPWRNDAARALPGSGHDEPGNVSSEAGGGQISIGVEAPDETRTFLPDVVALADPLPSEHTWKDTYALLAFAGAALLLWGAVWILAGQYLGSWATLGAWIAMLGLCVACAAAFAKTTAEQNNASLSRLAIVKWRRESSVFLGLPPPQQDTAWIFRLRMMELTRGAAGFLTQPSIALRVLARCVDYGVIAIAVAGVLWTLPQFVSFGDTIAALLRSALVLPLWVVLVAIVFDAVCINKFRMTPGKWLVGAVVVLGVTQPVDTRGKVARDYFAWQRAQRFASSAMRLGLWPLALASASATLASVRTDEGAWEAAGDSVVVVRQSPFFARAAAVVIVCAAAVFVASVWISDGQRVYRWVAANLTSTQKTISDVLPPISMGGEKTGDATLSVSASTAPAATPATPEKPSTSDAVPAVPVAAPPAKTADPASAASRIAQERRARIERVEAQVARARQSGSYADLQSSCLRWTDDQPGSAEAWRCLGLARFQAGDAGGALPALRQSLKLEPNDPQVESTILRILRP